MPSLSTNPIHLGLGATAEVLPVFTGDMAWYEAYGAVHGADGAEGRLVSLHTFTADWTSWEMHPLGAEVVVCAEGEITLIQEHPDGKTAEMTLQSGEYAINAPGVWHTANVSHRATALFITAGADTQVRPR